MNVLKNPRAAPIVRLLRDRRGSAFVEQIFALLLIMSLILTFMMIAPMFTVKLRVDYMARSLVRTVELSGQRGSEYSAELARLKTETNLSPAVTVSGSFSGDGKIQLRNAFAVTVSTNYVVKIATPAFGPPITATVPIVSTVAGRGEVYWKDWTG